MGVGLKLNLKWGLSVQPRLSAPNSSYLPSSTCSSFKGKDISYNMARTSHPFVLSMESETSCTCSSTSRILDIDYSQTDNIKRSIGKTFQDDRLTFLTCLQANKISQYMLLLENLVALEDTLSDSDVVTLEQDILVQLEKLGASKFIHAPYSKISENPREKDNFKPLVPSTRKVERKLRRERASRKPDGDVCMVEFPSKAKNSKSRRWSNSKGVRLKITRNEAELSRGVKMVADLERLRMMLEEETGLVVSFSRWAAAAGVDKNVLLENLHFGWCCRDELLKSTQSLVIYLAKNYSGQGIAFKDLIQAGNFGVLQGAERFDPSRGYKFSTYVQYWIRKSMSIFLSRHARGIRIPLALSKAINQIQKARKTLHNENGEYPDDCEIAKFTSLSMAKIASASKCFRVVGSIDHKIGHGISTKFRECTPDTTMMTPEETFKKKQMVEEIYDRMSTLDSRERKVLVLRFGLKGYQRKSLEETGRLFGVSKEWIRKIERKALTKLKVEDEETRQSLKHYLYI